jgi:hypothetical protein
MNHGHKTTSNEKGKRINWFESHDIANLNGGGGGGYKLCCHSAELSPTS